MKVSWIKYENDNVNFKVAEKLGMDVYRINDPEEIDNKMEELVKQHYDMIVLSNEMAGFSEDIVKKYKNNPDINIVISSRK